MLPRAARRKCVSQYLEREASNIRLPWLCPALGRSKSHAALHQKNPLLPATKRENGVPIGTRQPAKRLASAAASNHVPDDPHVPFSSQPNSSDQPRATKPPTGASSPFSSDLIMLDGNFAGLPLQTLKRKWGHGREIGGDQYEVYSTFDACLHVGRHERARSLAHRLAELLPENSAEIRAVFNRYLSALVSDMIRHSNYGNIDSVNTWIEVDMKKVGLAPDATTYALMIKAAIHSLSGAKRDRTVRRYWNVVNKRNEESEVASLHTILTDQDLGLISQVSRRLLNANILAYPIRSAR